MVHHLLSLKLLLLAVLFLHFNDPTVNAKTSPLKEFCDDRADVLENEFGDKTYDEMKSDAVEFFKKCIVELLDFKMEASPDDKDKTNFVQFKRLPTFEVKESLVVFSPMNTHFGIYAKVIEIFFTKAGGWKKIASDNFMKSSDGVQLKCKNLLYLVGARLAYYTHILWSATDKKIKQCQTNQVDKIIIPETVCYLHLSDTVRCTSNAKVDLIGEKAQEAVTKFNNYISSLKCIGSAGGSNNGNAESVKTQACNAESMIDTKVVVESLELATPEQTDNLDQDKQRILQAERHVLGQLDKSDGFQLLDVLLAMTKILGQNTGFFPEEFQQVITETKNEELAGYSTDFLKAVKENNLEEQTKSYNRIIEYIKKTDLPKSSTRGEAEALIFRLLESHVKFAYSYRSLGALRTIVNAMEMQQKSVIARLSLNDYIASALENYGFAYATLAKCKGVSYMCLAVASDYLWPVYSCLKAAKDILVDIGKGESLSEEAKMNIKRSRDYLAELLFMFKKNKEDVPEKYFSPQAYKDEVNFDDDNKDKIKPKEYNAIDLQKKYMNCENKEECLKTLENILIEYTKSMEEYQKISTSKHTVDRTVNSHFFNYVTTSPEDILNCYKDYKAKKPEICGIKSSEKNEANL